MKKIFTHSRNSSTSSVTSKRSLDNEENSDSEEKASKFSKMSSDELGKLRLELLSSQNSSVDTIKSLISEFNRNLTEQIQKISNDIKQIESKIDRVETSVVKANSEIIDLQNENQQIRNELNNRQQLNMRTHFNLFGLPALKQEDALIVMKNVALKVGTTVVDEDFKDIYVANHRDKKTSHIAGIFYNEQKRDEIFNKMKKQIADKKPILVEEVVKLARDSPFRGKELRLKTKLTQYTRMLLNDARQLKNIFKFIWECDGRILMRKDEHSRIIEIKTPQQLHNVASNHNFQIPTSNDVASYMETSQN